MRGTFKNIKVSKIVNYFENPRHAIGASEEDTLKKLFGAVGNQYMLNLAADIQEHGLLGCQQIVVVYSDETKKYIVYEGNRRVAAIKLLLHPDKFGFLDKPTVEKARRIAQGGSTPTSLQCYVTDEEEAMYIMERIHSGEDKGRGVKQWTSREKEVFRVRRSHEQKKNISYLIDVYVKKHCDGLDITTIIPFTTIQRLFNTQVIRKQIGLDVADENTFTADKMRLVVAASKWVVSEAEKEGVAITRLFNTAKAIEQRLLPWLQEFIRTNNIPAESSTPTSGKRESAVLPPQSNADTGTPGDEQETVGEESRLAGVGVDSGNQAERSSSVSGNGQDTNTGARANTSGSGGNKNLPYFFQGLQFGHLDPNDPDTHGVTAICKELQLFSDKKLVSQFPIASSFLTRSLIEQAIVFYSKKHNIQGQNKKIWEDVKDISKLSKVIDKYKRGLHNYITDSAMQQYFTNLFGDYEKTVDPLNWVVHRPAEFQLDPTTLIELPKRGLLTLINYMLSNG